MNVEISTHYDEMDNLIVRMYTKWSEEQESAFRIALATAWEEGVEAHRRFDYPENPYREEKE